MEKHKFSDKLPEDKLGKKIIVNISGVLGVFKVYSPMDSGELWIIASTSLINGMNFYPDRFLLNSIRGSLTSDDWWADPEEGNE